MFTEDAKVNPKITNPNTRNSVSPNWFQPLRFMKNSPDLGKDIGNIEESGLQVDFKGIARSSYQNSKMHF